MATLIKNGIIVTASDTYAADIKLDNEIISHIGLSLEPQPDDQVIDVSGCWILPGGIDVHTHLDMPLGDIRSTDDFTTGTIAAVFGGTTTIVDFIVPEKGQSLSQAAKIWRTKAEGAAVTDYGFHMCVVEMLSNTLGEMEALLEEGITSFKFYTAYPGALMVDDGALFRALRWAAKHEALIQVHAENGLAIAIMADDMVAQGKVEPVYHALSRPPRLEAEATSRVLALAEAAGAPIYIVHLSCTEALESVRGARGRGQTVYVETCPHYLYLTLDDLARPGFEGAKFVCSPPLREKYHAPFLWQALAASEVQVVATDHCPFNFREMKERGKHDFRQIPNGLPGIEYRLPLLFEGVTQGKISINRLVDAFATSPSKLFGLYPRKGTIVPGADADLVIWNPSKITDLSHANMHMQVDYSLYENQLIQGRVDKVLIRGRLILDNDQFIGPIGQGQYLIRHRYKNV